jgi:hypothetical protein
MSFWYPYLDGYEYETDENGHSTGFYRCVGGRLADGRWPKWHSETGAKGYC